MPSGANHRETYFIREGLLQALIDDGVISEDRSEDDVTQDILKTIEATHEICFDQVATHLEMDQIAACSGLTMERVKQLFGDVQGVMQGAITALRHTADAEIQGIAQQDIKLNWICDAPEIWDRHIEHLLTYYELSMKLKGTERPTDPAIPQRQTPEILDNFLESMASAGITITPKRREVAEFSLAMLGYFRQLIVSERDPNARRFLRDQVKTLVANYLPQAVISD